MFGLGLWSSGFCISRSTRLGLRGLGSRIQGLGLRNFGFRGFKVFMGVSVLGVQCVGFSVDA